MNKREAQIRAAVEAAYREGYKRGVYDAQYSPSWTTPLDTAWAGSQAHKDLEGLFPVRMVEPGVPLPEQLPLNHIWMIENGLSEVEEGMARLRQSLDARSSVEYDLCKEAGVKELSEVLDWVRGRKARDPLPTAWVPGIKQKKESP